MVSLQNAFISYGRADSKSFAIRLNKRLTEAGLTVWFDAEDIPYGIDYQDEIDAGIANSDNFLYVISPHSVNSAYCDKELLLALKYNKRIIPLMHVQEISRHTWQERHPDSPEADWQSYQDKGLHSSHINLHPAISRINWIFFCEDIHDFDQSVQDLLGVIDHNQGYTHWHTKYLTQALRWEEHHRQADYLLTTDASKIGQDWLQTQFIDSLPPCLPTRLHCEFITESVKASNEGMTHVFLSYSEEDRVYQEQVSQALMRQGLTVWSNTTDIRTGGEFQNAIYEGIERADAIVVLLSPQSLQSTYCQDELAYGWKYHKRIIPLMITPMKAKHLPERLREIQFIEGFASNIATQQRQSGNTDPAQTEATSEPVCQDAIAQLIRALYTHADYYTQHKELLVKALAWDRCDRPNDLVLRGQEFVAAEAWWEISQQTALQTTPTRLHQAFIQASQVQNRFFDAFISYGRADSLAFASRLHERLSNQGLNVWFDQQDIPVGVDFQAQIDDGIERSHNFIFIIAPHAVHSPYCLKEIELALRLNKRIIPLMHVEEITYETWQKRNPTQSETGWESYKATGKHSSFTGLHPEIGKINWIFFRETVDVFDGALKQLTTLLHLHERYVRQHTELLTRALEWQRHHYDSAHLLTGDQRRQAKTWLNTKFQEQPPCLPTVLHGELISASLKHANNFMTDVFLCYAEGDRSITEGRSLPDAEAMDSPLTASSLTITGPSSGTNLEETNNQPAKHHLSLAHSIRNHLVLKGLTVWDYATDIQSGEAIQTAIQRGIETADTVLYFITHDTITSPRCQQELDYALSLNKRIIPLQVEPLAVALPETLAQLNVIDIRALDQQAWQEVQPNAQPSEDTVRPLFHALQQDEAYYRTHKQLLAIALKWERQQKNPTVLLRGNTLKQYEAWVQMACQRSHHPPTALHTTFITESKKQPPGSTLDVFIIYAPEDFEFVRTLNETLQIQNKTTWFDETVRNTSIQDLEEIEQGKVNAGIDQSENIVFVISPSAIKDSRCIRELRYAHRRHKRIFPLLYREVLSAKEHPILAQAPWLNFQPNGDFSTQFGTLFRQLESDPDHIRPHTRLLVRSREWARAKRDTSYLLRGKELQLATDWLAQAEGKTPVPTRLQKRFIATSQALPFRKLRRRSIILTSLLSAGLVFGVRLFGGLLPLELWAYDFVLRMKPDEPQDDRFLMVQVDDESGRWLREKMKDGTYTPGIGTVPEAAMAEAITNLQAFHPSLIGLDFYRDFKADPIMADLLSQTENLLGLCKAESKATATHKAAPGYDPPAEMPIDRIGFNDFATEQGNILRRHLVKNYAQSSFCPTNDSFSLVLAKRYLQTQGIDYLSPWDSDGDGIDEENITEDLLFGEVMIPSLYYGNAAAYPFIRERDETKLSGYQTLINFRTHKGEVNQFAATISLKDVIQNNLTSEEVSDRIIIIGYVDESDRNADTYTTAHGLVSGVIMQGQLTSQLISQVLDGRSLIWWWPKGGDLLWTLGWSLGGGFVAWGVVRPRRFILTSIGLWLLLVSSCTLVMIVSSGWIPLIPPLCAGGLTAVITTIRNRQIRRP